MDITKPQVSILMGSDSDLPVMNEAANTLKNFGVGCEVKIISAHRTPHLLAEYVGSAEANGVKVFIAGAGGAAHLPGVTAAFTTCPVIGVPILGKSTSGLDSLLSIVQMPSGVPVATVAIGGAKNAALLSLQILAVGDESLKAKLKDYKKQLAEESIKKNEKIIS